MGPAVIAFTLLLYLAGCTSPELTRTRGGGPGADLGYRGEIVRIHEGARPFEKTPKIDPRRAPPSGSRPSGGSARPQMMASDTGLQDLERRHPEWGPWLAVVQEVLTETANPKWDALVPTRIEATQNKVPLLTSATISVENGFVRRWLEQLFRSAARSGTPKMATLKPVLYAELDTLSLFKASLCQEDEALRRTAAARLPSPRVGSKNIVPSAAHGRHLPKCAELSGGGTFAAAAVAESGKRIVCRVPTAV